MVRRRKKTSIPIVSKRGGLFKTRSQSASFISRYHQLKKLGTASAEQEMVNMGGLEAYEAASRRKEKSKGLELSKQNAGASFVMRLLKREYQEGHEKQESKDKNIPVGLLDVGCVENVYRTSGSWLQVRCIDLLGEAEGVEKCDVMTVTGVKYDVVCLCLVLNFVEREDRVPMLKHVRTLLKFENGRLALSLPKACVDNSRYTTSTSLKMLMMELGFNLLVEKRSEKLYHSWWGLSKPIVSGSRFPESAVIRHGVSRNNFRLV